MSDDNFSDSDSPGGRTSSGQRSRYRPRRPRGRGDKTRSQLTAVGGTLAGLLDGLGLSATLKGWEAISVWSETVGAPANERSRAVAFDAGRLIVEVESSAWMTQLSFLKRDIKARLNRRLGGDIIKDIQFAPPGSGGRDPETRKR